MLAPGTLMSGDNWTSPPVVLAGRRRRDRRRGLASMCAALASTLSRTGAEALRARGTVAEGPGGEPVMQHPLQYRDHPARVPREVPPLVEGPDRVPSWETGA
jgi:hypothetical protein